MTVELQDIINESEDFNLDWAAESQVDEEKGIIRNVPLCGNQSKNGYAIPESAFGSADRVRALYESKPVLMDHQLDRSPRQRSARDLAAVIKNTKLRNGKPWGDLHTEGCPEGPTLIRLAKAKIPHVGLSHTARYTFNRSRTSVESINEVFTVDAVLFPATTKSFTEQTSGGEKQMSDNAVEVLSESFKTQRESYETKIADLQKQVTTLEAEKVSLEANLKNITTERDAANAKVLAHESAQKVAERRASVIDKCKVAGIATEGEKAPKAWLEAVCAMESEASQQAAITEFAGLMKNAGVAGPTSQERQQDTSKQFSAESALSGIRFVN